MKIQFASDLHLEFRENRRYLRDNGPMDVKGDILVLAGDMGYLGDDMYIGLGNHIKIPQTSEQE